MIQALRGTRDILPEEVGYWQFIEATVREILGRGGISGDSCAHLRANRFIRAGYR